MSAGEGLSQPPRLPHQEGQGSGGHIEGSAATHSCPPRLRPSSESDSSSSSRLWALDALSTTPRSSWLKPCSGADGGETAAAAPRGGFQRNLSSKPHRELLLLFVSRFAKNICNHFPRKHIFPVSVLPSEQAQKFNVRLRSTAGALLAGAARGRCSRAPGPRLLEMRGTPPALAGPTRTSAALGTLAGLQDASVSLLAEAEQRQSHTRREPS